MPGGSIQLTAEAPQRPKSDCYVLLTDSSHGPKALAPWPSHALDLVNDFQFQPCKLRVLLTSPEHLKSQRGDVTATKGEEGRGWWRLLIAWSPRKGIPRQVLGGFETLPLPFNPPTACFLKTCAFFSSGTLDSLRSGMGLRSHTGLPLVKGTKRIPALPGQLVPQSYMLLLSLPSSQTGPRSN